MYRRVWYTWHGRNGHQRVGKSLEYLGLGTNHQDTEKVNVSYDYFSSTFQRLTAAISNSDFVATVGQLALVSPKVIFQADLASLEATKVTNKQMKAFILRISE